MKRALIIDDNAANRQLLVEILRGQIACDEADTGKIGLDLFTKALSKTPYDIVLLDIGMPDMNGLTVLFEIRNLEKSTAQGNPKQTPVIIVTAYKKLSAEAQRLGCDDYLTKPIDPVTILEIIEKKLGPLTP
jgi:CheY-like chemotaxis protein